MTDNKKWIQSYELVSWLAYIQANSRWLKILSVHMVKRSSTLTMLLSTPLCHMCNEQTFSPSCEMCLLKLFLLFDHPEGICNQQSQRSTLPHCVVLLCLLVGMEMPDFLLLPGCMVWLARSMLRGPDRKMVLDRSYRSLVDMLMLVALAATQGILLSSIIFNTPAFCECLCSESQNYWLLDCDNVCGYLTWCKSGFRKQLSCT